MTLPQLVAVCAISAALVLVAGPAALRAMARSQAIGCTANLRKIGRATGLYLADYDSTFPYAYGQPGVNCWYGALSTYLNVPHDPKGQNDWEKSASVFHCPGDGAGPSLVSYATNALISGAGAEVRQPGEKLAHVVQPSSTVWMGETTKCWTRKDGFYDTFMDWVRPEEDLGYPKTDDRAVAFYHRWLKDRDWTDLRATAFDCPDGLYQCKYPAFRHGRTGDRTGRATFLFVDGHVKACPWGSLDVVNFFPSLTPEQAARYAH